MCHTNKERTKHYITTATPVTDCKVETVCVPMGKLKPNAATPLYPVPQTRIQYNGAMSGVDLNNQYCARPTLWRQAHRWWLSIFLHFVNVAVVNSWYLRTKFASRTLPPITLPEFRHELMHELVGDFTARKRTGRPPSATSATNAHPSIVKIPDEKRKACSVCHYRVSVDGKQEDFGSQTSFQCSKCGMSVCRRVHRNKKQKGEQSCWNLHMQTHHKHFVRSPDS
ncbi:MAG: hypothetical protein ACK5PF_05090 [bacterium]